VLLHAALGRRRPKRDRWLLSPVNADTVADSGCAEVHEGQAGRVVALSVLLLAALGGHGSLSQGPWRGASEAQVLLAGPPSPAGDCGEPRFGHRDRFVRTGPGAGRYHLELFGCGRHPVGVRLRFAPQVVARHRLVEGSGMPTRDGRAWRWAFELELKRAGALGEVWVDVAPSMGGAVQRWRRPMAERGPWRPRP